MIQSLKTNFIQLIRDLDYHITDNGRYEENFPWLMLKLANRKCYLTYDIKFDDVTFVLDIFSTYPGEKEILEIADDILDNIEQLKQEMPEITHIFLKNMKIIDDNKTGPVRKHGVLNFSFILATGLEEYDE